MTTTTTPAGPSAGEVLRELEWSYPTHYTNTRELCPVCFRGKLGGGKHKPDCRLAAALVAPPSAELDAVRAERDAALTRAQQVEQEHTDMMWQRRRADERATAAEARVQVLEEALRPISLQLETWSIREWPDSQRGTYPITLRIDEVRRARAALSTSQDGQKGGSDAG